MSRRDLFLAIGFVFLWNSGFIGAEYGLPYTGPFTLVFWRYLALTLVMFLILLIRRRFIKLSWTTVGLNMLVGVLAHGAWLTGVLLALEQEVPAGIVALVVALQPLTTGALSGKVVGEPTHFYKWIGLLLGFIGVALTVSFRIDFESPSSIFGYLIPVGSVVGITAASVIQRKIDIVNPKHKLPVDLTLFYQSLATTMALAFPAVFAEQLSTQWEPEFIYTMIWLILAVSMGAYSLMWLLIEDLDATQVASLFYLGPPVTMFMAWIAFGDSILLMDVVGLLVVFMGVLVTQMKKDRTKYSATKTNR